MFYGWKNIYSMAKNILSKIKSMLYYQFTNIRIYMFRVKKTYMIESIGIYMYTAAIHRSLLAPFIPRLSVGIYLYSNMIYLLLLSICIKIYYKVKLQFLVNNHK